MKKSGIFSAVAAVLLISVVLVGNTFAYNVMDARYVALGGAHLSSARGNDVIGWNPAYLGFSDNPRLSITIPGLNFSSRWVNDFFSINLMNTYAVDGMNLSINQRKDIISKVDGNEIDISQDNFVPVFAVSFPLPYVMFGISADAGTVADMSISDEFLKLGLLGHSLDDYGEYREFENSGKALAAARVGLTFAKAIEPKGIELFDEIAVGGTFYYYRGIAFAELTEATGRIYTERDSLAGDGLAHLFYTNLDSNDVTGSGIGLDLGFGAKMMNKRLEVGLSFQNVGAKIEWDGVDHRVYEYEIKKTPSTRDFNETEDTTATGDENIKFFEKIFSWENTNLEKNFSYSTDLPSYMHLSTGYWFTHNLLVSASLRKGLNETFGSDGGGRFGMGLQFDGLKVIPLRVGFAAGGRGATQIGAGFGLHFGFWQTDIGWAFEDGIGNAARGFQFALNTTFQFGRPEKEDLTGGRRTPRYDRDGGAKRPESDKRSRVKPPNRRRR